MAEGAALARRGELQRLAEQALRQRPTALERQRQLAAAGSRLGTTLAGAFRARRDRQARALGYEGLEDFYRRQYCDQHARLAELVLDSGAPRAPYAATSNVWASAPTAPGLTRTVALAGSAGWVGRLPESLPVCPSRRR